MARPTIPTEPAGSLEEQFQNNTLRPILKQQNEHLIMTFRFFLIKRKTRWEKFDALKREAHIRHSVRKDRELRQLLFGLILGQCTIEELHIYYSNEAPLRRRLGKLIEQRLIDQLGGIG
ncbi:MAG: glyoxalase [Bacteroidetes bacterium]|nr:MAG: glyoxalase [Bacteroidota bacterium]